MGYVVADRVTDTSTTMGTGNITLDNAASTGYRTLDAVAVAGDVFPYALRHQANSEWETGLGRYNGSHVFVREVVRQSSNSDAVVNFSAGVKDFSISPIAFDAKYSLAKSHFGGI